MKNIITYGTFDLLHVGHINILRRAKELGDYLIVGISSDEFNALKHKTSFMCFEDRKVILESIKYVDLVIKEDSWGQKEHDIKKYNIDTFVMGDDWEGQFDQYNQFCEVTYLSRTAGISSTKRKDDMGI